ncbi:MAG: hypothetical protein GY862_25350 [Gammaproteobacteria bacterium]|nr:hypothetical protein [Gammaproteobacteria bacterium]
MSEKIAIWPDRSQGEPCKWEGYIVSKNDDLLDRMRSQADDDEKFAQGGGAADLLNEAIDEIRELERDAARYRKLREMDWRDSRLVIVRPGAAHAGAMCLAGDRLDEAVDKA